MTSRLSHGIGIHSDTRIIRETGHDFLLKSLSSDTPVAYPLELALGAAIRFRLLKIAIMAHDQFSIPVMRHGDRTIGAIQHVPTFGTLDRGGIATTV